MADRLQRDVCACASVVFGPEHSGLGCQDYIVEKIYEVPRGGGAELALEVDDEIAQYERGIGGVHAGMSESELLAAKGEPESKSTEQVFNVSWWTYPDMRVLVVSGEVKSIARR